MPLKRHPALQDLSRDHHQFLLAARSVRWWVEGDERAEPLAETIASLLEFWESDGEPHLREEEQVLFTLCQQYIPNICEELELERHLILDHAWLRGKMAELREIPPLENSTALLRTLSNFLENHIRHEERVVFQRIQQALNPTQLAELHQRSVAFRRKERGSAAIGGARSGEE